MKRITLPAEVDGLHVVASASGGKDSTALILALREADIPARYVFADTGWEATETYEYLDLLRERLGITIDVVGVPGGMRALADKHAGFPLRMARWCTKQLKLEPIRRYLDAIEEETGIETVSAVGVRRDESDARSNVLELEDSDEWGGYIWRPLATWTVADVLHTHRRHGIPVNPLYQAGFDRVGCYPCIYSSKGEIALLAQRSPERISEIAERERALSAERERRNAETPGRYATTTVTFFQAKADGVPQPVESVVEWANTARGGRQTLLFAPAPRGGCMRWGLCETSATAPEGE